MPARWNAVAVWMRGDGDEARLVRRMVWVGLAVRVLYLTLAHTYRLRALLDHFEFGWEMGRIARALVTGYGYADPFNGHSGPTAWTPPLYPLLLAGVFRVFGVYTRQSAWVILTINSIFSAATAAAVYEIARRCFAREPNGRSIALWAGWLWALYPAAMQYAVKWVWDMALTAFLFSCVFVLALRIRGIGEEGNAPSSRARRWVGFGVLWGLIALANSSLLTFLPACGLWMVWPALRGSRAAAANQALRHAALAAVCFVLMISPWVARNWVTFHAFIPMRANFGAELLESAQLTSAGFPWMATLPLADAAPQFQEYRRLGEVAYSQQQGAQARALIAGHRGLFATHVVERIYFFWFGVPHPVDSVLVEAGRRINYAFLSVAGLLGLALALYRRMPGAWLFFWAFAVFPLIYYLVTVQARFRHPLEPLICVLSVYLFQSADRTSAWSGFAVK